MIYGYLLNNSNDIEPLNEGRICNEDGFLITIDFSMTETNFRYDPYFKVYPSASFDAAEEVARIHFLNKLSYEKPHKGKDVITLSNSQLKIVCSLIKKYWKKLLNEFVKGCNITGEDKKNILSTPYPEELYDTIKN